MVRLGKMQLNDVFKIYTKNIRTPAESKRRGKVCNKNTNQKMLVELPYQNKTKDFKAKVRKLSVKVVGYL